MHDPNNNDCPWNDPGTFMHPATAGLDCRCPPSPEVKRFCLTFLDACFLVQAMVASRSLETSIEATTLRKKLANGLELIFPGILEHASGRILLQ